MYPRKSILFILISFPLYHHCLLIHRDGTDAHPHPTAATAFLHTHAPHGNPNPHRHPADRLA